jgi:hypothetical protein
MALGLFSIMLQIMNPTKLANRTENDLLIVLIISLLNPLMMMVLKESNTLIKG